MGSRTDEPSLENELSLCEQTRFCVAVGDPLTPAYTAHLRVCPECAAFARDMRTLDKVLPTLAAPPLKNPSGQTVSDAVMKELSRQAHLPTKAMPKLFRYAGFAAACLVIAAGAWYTTTVRQRYQSAAPMTEAAGYSFASEDSIVGGTMLAPTPNGSDMTESADTESAALPTEAAEEETEPIVPTEEEIKDEAAAEKAANGGAVHDRAVTQTMDSVNTPSVVSGEKAGTEKPLSAVTDNTSLFGVNPSSSASDIGGEAERMNAVNENGARKPDAEKTPETDEAEQAIRDDRTSEPQTQAGLQELPPQADTDTADNDHFKLKTTENAQGGAGGSAAEPFGYVDDRVEMPEADAVMDAYDRSFPSEGSEGSEERLAISAAYSAVVRQYGREVLPNGAYPIQIDHENGVWYLLYVLRDGSTVRVTVVRSAQGMIAESVEMQ